MVPAKDLAIFRAAISSESKTTARVRGRRLDEGPLLECLKSLINAINEDLCIFRTTQIQCSYKGLHECFERTTAKFFYDLRLISIVEFVEPQRFSEVETRFLIGGL